MVGSIFVKILHKVQLACSVILLWVMAVNGIDPRLVSALVTTWLVMGLIRV